MRGQLRNGSNRARWREKIKGFRSIYQLPSESVTLTLSRGITAVLGHQQDGLSCELIGFLRVFNVFGKRIIYSI